MASYIKTPNEKELLAIREKYKAGTRVRLTEMDDTYAPPIDKISRRMLVTSAIDGWGNPVRVWYTRAQLAVS